MDEQYFTDSAPASADETHVIEVSARGFDLSMRLSSRVFSGSKLDLGTRQLLSVAPDLPEGGTFLDLGCGSGRDTKYFLEHGYRVDAIDGSAELCALASEYTGIPVKCQLFQELDASEVYDGIWACSSLLHLSYGELDEVLYRIEKALKPQGILYMSFKYGVFEGERNGRYFLDFTEEKLEQLLKKHTSLQQLRNFLTEDVRPDREERWLNLFLKKINS